MTGVPNVCGTARRSRAQTPAADAPRAASFPVRDELQLLFLRLPDLELPAQLPVAGEDPALAVGRPLHLDVAGADVLVLQLHRDTFAVGVDHVVRVDIGAELLRPQHERELLAVRRPVRYPADPPAHDHLPRLRRAVG